ECPPHPTTVHPCQQRLRLSARTSKRYAKYWTSTLAGLRRSKFWKRWEDIVQSGSQIGHLRMSALVFTALSAFRRRARTLRSGS
ncbi:hypothetical protein LTR54_018452, partial [Friedmanniomyces endolithicus]